VLIPVYLTSRSSRRKWKWGRRGIPSNIFRISCWWLSVCHLAVG